MNSDLKLLIFHDSLDVYGGAERVISVIAKAFDAHVAALNVDSQIAQDLGIDKRKLYDLGRIDSRPPVGPIRSSLLFRRAHFPGFDRYLLSGSWSLYASYNHKPNVFYCHTPCRVFYDLKAYNIRCQSNFAKKAVAWGWTTTHGRLDKQAIGQVDKMLANSRNVQQRIARYYGRESTVVYPPVSTNQYHTKEFNNFWLSVNRLFPEKRVDLQIETFKHLPDEDLLIVGGFSPRDKSLERYHKLFVNLPRNVTILGAIPEMQLHELYATCKGVVYTPIDEDFGLVPLEAQASGKAVVGVNEGGLRETVIDGVTGFLVNPDPESMRIAIQRVSEEPGRYENACKKNASRFDEKVFVNKMRQCLSEIPSV